FAALALHPVGFIQGSKRAIPPRDGRSNRRRCRAALVNPGVDRTVAGSGWRCPSLRSARIEAIDSTKPRPLTRRVARSAAHADARKLSALANLVGAEQEQ